MLIGIISDTHGDLQGWQQALAGPFKEVDEIWHCGDILYHGPRNPLPADYNPAKLADLINHCPKPLLAVQGNCDSEVDQMVLNVALQSPFILLDHPYGRILISHGHRYSSELMLEMVKHYKVKIWLSGHTHLPLLEKKDDLILVNPGSPTLPKGAQPRRSVALLSSTTIELYDLDLNQVYERMELNA